MPNIPSEKDPLGKMLHEYLEGRTDAFVRVDSPDLEMTRMKGSTLFRAPGSGLEGEALARCRGRVLDAGAGAGCHSLELQDRRLDVTALDISPGCVAVMKRRGVRQVCHENIFSHEGGPYDTLLMLMNGIGICGTIGGLNFFFQHIRGMLSPGGQVLADSTDLSSMYTAIPIAGEPYYGETRFTMSYGEVTGDPFDWLYIDFATLAFYAEFHGWRCDQVFRGEEGKYLARIY